MTRISERHALTSIRGNLHDYLYVSPGMRVHRAHTQTMCTRLTVASRFHDGALLLSRSPVFPKSQVTLHDLPISVMCRARIGLWPREQRDAPCRHRPSPLEALSSPSCMYLWNSPQIRQDIGDASRYKIEKGTRTRHYVDGGTRDVQIYSRYSSFQ